MDNKIAIILNQSLSETAMNGIIDSSVHELDIFSKKIEEANSRISNSEQKLEHSISSANTAQRKAKNVTRPGLVFGKKAAIEDTQAAAKELANAQVAEVEATQSNTEAIKSLTDAVKVSFEYQKKILEITEFLAAIGLTNAANNNTLIRQVEMRLKGASEKQISGLVQTELRNVLERVKAQRSLFQNVEAQGKKISANEIAIAETRKDIEEHKIKLEQNDIKNAEQDERLKLGDKKDDEQDKRLDIGDIKDDEQDKRISKNTLEISSQKEKDIEHDDRIEALEQIIKQQADEIALLKASLRRSKWYKK